MPFYTYILRCNNDSLYTGWTDDIETRVRKHNEGKGARYTRANRPVTLEIYWQFEDKSTAMRAEYYLKQLPRSKKLSLISGQHSLATLVPLIDHAAAQQPPVGSDA